MSVEKRFITKLKKGEFPAIKEVLADHNVLPLLVLIVGLFVSRMIGLPLFGFILSGVAAGAIRMVMRPTGSFTFPFSDHTILSILPLKMFNFYFLGWAKDWKHFAVQSFIIVTFAPFTLILFMGMYSFFDKANTYVVDNSITLEESGLFEHVSFIRDGINQAKIMESNIEGNYTPDFEIYMRWSGKALGALSIFDDSTRMRMTKQMSAAMSAERMISAMTLAGEPKRGYGISCMLDRDDRILQIDVPGVKGGFDLVRLKDVVGAYDICEDLVRRANAGQAKKV